MSRLITIGGISIPFIGLGVLLVSNPATFQAWTGITPISLGILMFIVWGIGGSFVDYSTRYKLNPLGQLDIIFELPLWKRFLALIPPSLADIKAEIRYRLEGENRWQGPIIATPVNNIGMKTLTVWKQDAKNRLFQVDEVSTPLPPTFILSVRLLRQADGKCIADFEIEYAQPPNSPN